MKIDEFTKLDSPEKIESFLDDISRFHDSLIKEIHLVNTAFVDSNRSMSMDFEYNARLLIQSQFNPIGIEMILIDIRKIHFVKLFEIFGGTIKEIKENEELIELTFDDEVQLECRDILFKIQEGYFGNQVFLNGQVPKENMVYSVKIENSWRQCEHCSEAWKLDEKIEISACPKCNKLTELKK